MKTEKNGSISSSVKIGKFLLKLFPSNIQRILSKKYFFRQIKSGNFRSAEVEWDNLEKWLKPGDCCIDVGANIGRYTLKMSKIVGNGGLVIAFEPLTKAFDMLVYFVNKGSYRNISLLNAAASDNPAVINVVTDFGGTNNPYIFETNTKTKISNIFNEQNESKLAISIDSLNLPKKINLIKIDVEGHELEVCKGMVELLKRDYPVLIIEDNDSSIADFLSQFGYEGNRFSDDGRNLVFIAKGKV
jgi:FkbM family methyltransferase